MAQRRERLARYLTRPAFSLARLRLRRGGTIAWRVKQASPRAGDTARDDARRASAKRDRVDRPDPRDPTSIRRSTKRIRVDATFADLMALFAEESGVGTRRAPLVAA